MISVYTAHAQIEEFLCLEPNWDSYDADVVSVEAANIAHQLIEQYSNNIYTVSPSPDGGILIEWLGAGPKNDHRLDIFIDAQGKYSGLLLVKTYTEWNNLEEHQIRTLHNMFIEREGNI